MKNTKMNALNEKELKTFNDALSSFLDKEEERERINEESRRKNREEKLSSGEWIEVDGKIYIAEIYNKNNK